MRIDYFVTLQKVIASGSFALAAKEVHVTPSAVSMQIKTLERYFGQSLFNRTGQNVQATPFAIELNREMTSVVSYLQRLRGSSAGRLEGTLKLGTVGLMQPVVLPHLFGNLKKNGHNIRIVCSPGRSQDLIEAVKVGQLDAAIVAEPEQARRKQLEWQVIREEQFYLITPPNIDYVIGQTDPSDWGWVGYDRASELGRLSKRIAESTFNASPPLIELQSLPAVISMVASGFGMAVVVLPEATMANHYGVNVYPLSDEKPRLRFSLVTRKLEKDSALIDEIKRCIAR
ncbi:LysR family transcriptional regulator [Pseudomonas matsuisoli]|uniref:LysR family transcriptional regulator n=1 Tax=Pseudomonas matsuisoli TaxID=1515666 RepID=A0A917PN23_9PSED|nr:LysR family transcriptional regulator [Pseudomonas matsuisoli]GGJ85701.1 LysR family transcriptional regulator [Pseudomonas matsuisoli]